MISISKNNSNKNYFIINKYSNNYFHYIYIQWVPRKVLENHKILGKSAMQGVKLKMALGLPVGALINCADNSGKILF